MTSAEMEKGLVPESLHGPLFSTCRVYVRGFTEVVHQCCIASEYSAVHGEPSE